MQPRLIPSLVAIAAIALNSGAPLAAQTRPAPAPTAVPLPAPARPAVRPVPPPVIRPTPLPQPVPNRPPVQPPTNSERHFPGINGYAHRIRCESFNGNLRRCSARTQNRVALLNRHGGTCRQGLSWGYTSNSIWVTRGCRATFGYGLGNGSGNNQNNGPSTGAVIGGVIVAGGLLALLASRNNSSGSSATSSTAPSAASGPFSPGPPAAVSADLAMLDVAARPSMQTCMFEASRQIGATGGTHLRLDRVTKIEPGNGGYRFTTELTATYPDGDRRLPMFCRATPTTVVQLDFASS